ncbi:porin family protein [Natronogracilivirga saccharolytica]|uniref:PorT family protein n=1 Tax=Natronogracilivirga saccharolytica TaxID=2812953 RepID=A0A8J7RKU6_9BACT|nr:porin family protein [Natronogracilivirga saccharolytica]MBP3193555.1 PorT family protein [Natronogracilivirga saccharolytica]
MPRISASSYIFTLAILLVTMLFVRPAQSQLLDYGVKGGVNFSSITETDNSDMLTGFHFGGFVNIRPPLSPISIQPEVLYTRLGTNFEIIPSPGVNDLEPDVIEETLTIDYLQIPVLLNYYLPLPGPLGPKLFAGPYVGFKMDSEYDSEINDIDLTDQLNDLDFGLVFGAGTDISLLLATVHVEARFMLGLESVYTEDFDNDERNRAIMLSAGIAF